MEGERERRAPQCAPTWWLSCPTGARPGPRAGPAGVGPRRRRGVGQPRQAFSPPAHPGVCSQGTKTSRKSRLRFLNFLGDDVSGLSPLIRKMGCAGDRGTVEVAALRDPALPAESQPCREGLGGRALLLDTALADWAGAHWGGCPLGPKPCLDGRSAGKGPARAAGRRAPGLGHGTLFRKRPCPAGARGSERRQARRGRGLTVAICEVGTAPAPAARLLGARRQP